jgi:hypothetical protein
MKYQLDKACFPVTSCRSGLRLFSLLFLRERHFSTLNPSRQILHELPLYCILSNQQSPQACCMACLLLIAKLRIAYYRVLLIANCSLLIIYQFGLAHHSPLTTHHSLLTTHHSPIPHVQISPAKRRKHTIQISRAKDYFCCLPCTK